MNSGNLERLTLSVRDLADSAGPRTSLHKSLSSALLVGHKQTKLFSIDFDSGIAKNVDSSVLSESSRGKRNSENEKCPPNQQSGGPNEKKSTEPQCAHSPYILLGKAEYMVEAINAKNGSVRWAMQVGEYTVYPRLLNGAWKSNNVFPSSMDQTLGYPTFEIVTTGDGNSPNMLVARHPFSGSILWQKDVSYREEH